MKKIRNSLEQIVLWPFLLVWATVVYFLFYSGGNGIINRALYAGITDPHYAADTIIMVLSFSLVFSVYWWAFYPVAVSAIERLCQKRTTHSPKNNP